MEKTMVLQNLSPVKQDEYTDKSSGQLRTIHYCELTLSDGIDTIVAELPIPPTKDATGQTTYPQPELLQGVAYGVAMEITGRVWEKDGRSGYSNRCRIRKITRL